MSKDEIMDEELIGMVSYTDETAPAEMPRMEHKAAPKAEPKHADVRDAEYVPLVTRKRTDMGRVAGCAKWIGICGGISMLLWCFWVNDLMAMEAAYPCILASAVIGGIGVGRSSK